MFRLLFRKRQNVHARQRIGESIFIQFEKFVCEYYSGVTRVLLSRAIREKSLESIFASSKYLSESRDFIAKYILYLSSVIAKEYTVMYQHLLRRDVNFTGMTPGLSTAGKMQFYRGEVCLLRDSAAPTAAVG